MATGKSIRKERKGITEETMTHRGWGRTREGEVNGLRKTGKAVDNKRKEKSEKI